MEYNNQESIMWYEKDGEPVWEKELGHVFAKAVIPYGDVIIASLGSWDSEEVNFGVFDTKGNLLEKDDIYNYYPKNGDFYPEFFVELEDGFITASTKDSNPLATQLMYFSKPYKIEVKTDGNGTITAEKTSFKNFEVKFTVTPKEGYVLDVVKVTDASGNVVYFKDYTFTMPSANVTIEATFVKDTNASESAEKPEEKNPKTGAYISYVIFSTAILIGIGIIALEKNHKNKIWKI